MAATLFSWGWQGFGQCGAGVPGVGDEEALFEPHRVPPFSDSRIADVAPGNRIIDLLSGCPIWIRAWRGEPYCNYSRSCF